MSETPSYKGSGDLYVFLADTDLHMPPESYDNDAGDETCVEIPIVDEHGTQTVTLRFLDGERKGVAELLQSIANVIDPSKSAEQARIRRQAYIAYLYLSIADCPRCHLPSAQGYVCPCGYDGAE